MSSRTYLDRWLRGLTTAEADRAVLGAGLRPEDVGAAAADVDIGKRPGIARWSLTEERLRHVSEQDPRVVGAIPIPASGLRLAVETDLVPAEVLQRLLRVEEVASAFVAVERPAGSLRARPWRWPMRVGLVGFPELDAEEVARWIHEQWDYLSPMVDVRRLESDPGAVDVAVVQGPPLSALSQLAGLKPVANALVVLGDPGERSPVVEATLAAARAITGAGASALIAPTDVPLLIATLVRELSHAQPLDVGLTTAIGRDVLVWAEPAAMERANVPEIAKQRASEIEHISYAATLPPPRLQGVVSDLRSAAEGLFRHEYEEAEIVAVMSETVEPELEALVEERWCQALVGAEGDHVFRCGSNPVAFFVGPLEEGALATPESFDDSDLPWDEEDADVFRLTIVFVPAGRDAVAQRDEIELPRFGRSSTARFELEVGEDAKEVAARVIVLFRNRILQTAVLRGQVGKKARLTNMVALVPRLAALDDRRPFDVAIMANHTNGTPQVTGTRDGDTRVWAGYAVAESGRRIADLLAKAAVAQGTPKHLGMERARGLLVSLAVQGRDLFRLLKENLADVTDASRIQIVSGNSGWFLPLEIVYSRKAPREDATLCPRYLADPATCDGRCPPEDERATVCPNAFWGLSKTIERHRFDADLDPTLQLLRIPAPREVSTLMVNRIVFGASARVTAKDRAKTVRALGAQATAVESWDEWLQSLKAAPTELLVLLPHTDSAKATLEICDATRERGEIEEDYVTGEREDVNPIVILFGCRTAGTKGDPAGFAARFMQSGASVVFHSTTDLKNSHATELARRLSARLAQPRDEMLSEALAAFRREAVHDGYLAGFAIAAFGDADWRV